jgi:hypothetical protein
MWKAIGRYLTEDEQTGTSVGPCNDTEIPALSVCYNILRKSVSCYLWYIAPIQLLYIDG